MTPRAHISASHLVAVGVGGVLGAAARWALVNWLHPATANAPSATAWPPGVGLTADIWATTLVNILGSFLLGALTGYALRTHWPSWLTAGLGIGLLGSFTTLSAIAVAWAAGTLAVAEPDVFGADRWFSALLGAGTGALALAATAAIGTLAATCGLLLFQQKHRIR